MNKEMKDTQHLNPEMKRKQLKNIFAKIATSAAVLAFLKCGGGSEPHFISSRYIDYIDDGDVRTLNDVEGVRDGGTVQEDTGTVAKECVYNTYYLLRVGEKYKAVKEGEQVVIGDKSYSVNKAQDGSLVLHSDKEFYVVRDTAQVNGVDVLYLGVGTTLTNAALLEIEYYHKGVVSAKKMALSAGESIKYNIDNEHYIVATLKEVFNVKNNGRKSEYATIDVELFVKSTEGDNTFISAKKGSYTVSADGVKNIVLDDETGLAVNVDLLGVGTTNATAKLRINGKEVNLKKGDKAYEVKVNNVRVGIDAMSIYCSESVSQVTLKISSPTKLIVATMMADEKVNIEVDDSGQRVHIEMVGCEPNCKEE